MPRNPQLTVDVDADIKGLEKGLDKASGKVSKFGAAGAKIKGIAAVAAPAAAAIGGAAVATVKLSKAADKANTDVAAFDLAMKNAGVEAGKMDPALQGAIAGAKEMAFTSSEARSALEPLALATGDAAKAADLLAIAQDVARLSGADLTVAADAVAKAYNGQDRALKALIPGLESGATGLDTIANAEAAAAGQAEIFAGSVEGLGIKGNSAFKALAVSIGQVLLPIVQAFMPLILTILDALSQLITAVLPVLTPLIKVLARAFETAAVAIEKVVGWVIILIDKIKALLEPLGKAVEKLRELNPFGAKMGGIVSGAQSAAVGVSTLQSGGAAGSGGGGVQINIYGDPSVIEAKVTKALRDYARRNGVGSVFAPGRS